MRKWSAPKIVAELKPRKLGNINKASKSSAFAAAWKNGCIALQSVR